eukprot:5645346-Amphidinium_carterae.2
MDGGFGLRLVLPRQRVELYVVPWFNAIPPLGDIGGEDGRGEDQPASRCTFLEIRLYLSMKIAAEPTRCSKTDLCCRNVSQALCTSVHLCMKPRRINLRLMKL